MSRKKSGGFGKVLEFIGLVDDGDARDTYVDEYSSGDYGRQQPYMPQRSRVQERPRQEISRRYPASSYEPTRTPRMNRTAPAGSSRFDSGRAPQGNPQRRSGAYVEQASNRGGRYDYSPRASRFGSLDDNGNAFNNAYPKEEQPKRPQRGATSRQKTVMFTLHALEDCCDVIDNLILNNTVVLTLDNLDVKLMQRAIDTLSGAVFALHATIRKASEHTYLIAPNSVEVNETYDMDRGF